MANFRVQMVLAMCLSFLWPASAETPAESAILKLNSDMHRLYGGALKDAQLDLLSAHPVILARFTGQGGDMVLYRPGQAPLVAERVPIRYELIKSVGHSAMAVFAHSYANLDKPASDWRDGLTSFRTTSQKAQAQIPLLDLPADWKDTMLRVVKLNTAFMDHALVEGRISEEALQKFAQDQNSDLRKLIAWAAETQVDHWMTVLDGWKAMLGTEWDKTYACSNTLYVTRQNNILFQVLAQYFGKSAMNTRLFLFETTAFTTEPEQMLGLMARIVADRKVGDAFFGDFYLMDYELMGGDAHRAIVQQMEKRGQTPLLPPLVPFRSNEWPMRHDPKEGSGPARLDQIPAKR